MVTAKQPLLGEQLHLARRQAVGLLQRSGTTSTIRKNPLITHAAAQHRRDVVHFYCSDPSI